MLGNSVADADNGGGGKTRGNVLNVKTKIIRRVYALSSLHPRLCHSWYRLLSTIIFINSKCPILFPKCCLCGRYLLHKSTRTELARWLFPTLWSRPPHEVNNVRLPLQTIGRGIDLLYYICSWMIGKGRARVRNQFTLVRLPGQDLVNLFTCVGSSGDIHQDLGSEGLWGWLTTQKQGIDLSGGCSPSWFRSDSTI